mmetsp:Transcript_32074/g.99072  ORF Transcript_32074/g.99072 Transcript_32074/m.99072 type:complete len:230 (-) Transcript_32074:194-883(-)
MKHVREHALAGRERVLAIRERVLALGDLLLHRHLLRLRRRAFFRGHGADSGTAIASDHEAAAVVGERPQVDDVRGGSGLRRRRGHRRRRHRAGGIVAGHARDGIDGIDGRRGRAEHQVATAGVQVVVARERRGALVHERVDFRMRRRRRRRGRFAELVDTVLLLLRGRVDGDGRGPHALGPVGLGEVGVPGVLRAYHELRGRLGEARGAHVHEAAGRGGEDESDESGPA